MSDSLLAALRDLLGPKRVLTGEALRERYVHIWRMTEGLRAQALVLPQNTQEVAAIVRLCHQRGQSIAIHGGLTNLVGSTDTRPEQIVLSTERLNRIEEVDEQSRSITVQSGVILSEVQAAARERELLFPLNFGAKGSARIGGILSTNAGGLRVFRFGMTRQLVLGLEAVLPDGTIVNSLKKIIKDNSGYDLKQLFIGSEGTLGIITRAVLKLVEMPRSRNSAVIGMQDYQQATGLLKFLDRNLAGTLSAYELIWPATYRAMTSPPAIPKPPLPYDYAYYVLVDSLGSHPEADRDRLLELLLEAQERGLLAEAVPALSEADLDWFWRIREDVRVVADRSPYDQHFDVSLPISDIGAYVAQRRPELARLEGVEGVYAFGHVADGNVHFIIGKTRADDGLRLRINELVYAPLRELGGSVSAEHGIGTHKKAYLHLSRSPAEIALMRLLKNSLAPRGILNPGLIL